MKTKETTVMLKCDCGCSMFVVERSEWDDGEVDYNISVQGIKKTAQCYLCRFWFCFFRGSSRKRPVCSFHPSPKYAQRFSCVDENIITAWRTIKLTRGKRREGFSPSSAPLRVPRYILYRPLWSRLTPWHFYMNGP
jgi:hypothetical protein